MCFLTGWIFKDDKKLLTCSLHIPASTNHCFKKLIEIKCYSDMIHVYK
jgi:hypothetical protein